MKSVKGALGKKVARAMVRHSARGVVAKLQRRPARSASLVGFGVVIGAAAGWLAGHRGG